MTWVPRVFFWIERDLSSDMLCFGSTNTGKGGGTFPNNMQFPLDNSFLTSSLMYCPSRPKDRHMWHVCRERQRDTPFLTPFIMVEDVLDILSVHIRPGFLKKLLVIGPGHWSCSKQRQRCLWCSIHSIEPSSYLCISLCIHIYIYSIYIYNIYYILCKSLSSDAISSTPPTEKKIKHNISCIFSTK